MRNPNNSISKESSIQPSPLVDPLYIYGPPHDVEDLEVYFNGRKYGFLYEWGDVAIEPIFDMAYPFVEGYAKVMVITDGISKWGFIEKYGYYNPEPIYEEVRNASEGFAAVKLDGKWGFHSFSIGGSPCMFDEVKDFRESRAIVKYEGFWAVMTKQNEFLTDFIYDDVTSYTDGYAIAKIGNMQFTLNIDGEEITK